MMEEKRRRELQTEKEREDMEKEIRN